MKKICIHALILIFILSFTSIYALDLSIQTDTYDILKYVEHLDHNKLRDSDIRSEIHEILTLKYLFSASMQERTDIEHALSSLEKRTAQRASFVRIKIPCDEIKHFIAKRRYKAIPHHTPTSGWAYETNTTEPFTVGLIGSKESTGANNFQDWSYWNRLWLKFDLSSLAAYDTSKIIDAEIAVYNVSIVMGQTSENGMNCRIIRNEPQTFRDADHSKLLPSDADTVYDYIYHEYNNGELAQKVKNGLKTYGYGYPHEFAKLQYLKNAVGKWLSDGNNGVILFGDDLAPADSGNRKHIKQIKKENIFLFVDIEE